MGLLRRKWCKRDPVVGCAAIPYVHGGMGGGRLEFGRWTSIMNGSRFGMVDISGLEMILSPRGNLLLPRHVDRRPGYTRRLPPARRLVHPDPLATYHLLETVSHYFLNAKRLFTASVFLSKAKHTTEQRPPSPLPPFTVSASAPSDPPCTGRLASASCPSPSPGG